MSLPKNKIFIFIIVAILAIGGFVFIKNRPNHSDQGQSIYYCPMHPTYTSDRPGVCPICNMNLVKKEDTTDMDLKEKIAQKLRDICIMHKCDKVHDGKPCPMMIVGKEGEEIDCPICGRHVISGGEVIEKKIAYWTDPMIPGFKSDKPGKSPMGMDMVPVYEENASVASSAPAPDGYAPVLVTAQKQQLIGIKTAAVERKKLSKSIRTVGTIAHDPELYQAQTEFIQAIAAFERAKQSNIPEIVDQSKRLVESTRIRLKHMGLSDELISEVAVWKEAEHSLLFAHPGEPVWMYAQVYEYELPLIRVGQEVKAEVSSLAGKIFQGNIRAIDQMVDQMTRTTRIRAQLQDLDGQLKPDMYVNVSIEIDLGETLSVPAEAVFDTGTKKIVFIDKGQGLFEPRDVLLGAKADNDYQVKNGVVAGEKVVTSGNFLIDSESRLKAALEGLSSGEGVYPHRQ